MKYILQLAACFLITYGTAAAGSAVTFPALSTWYQTIDKPFFTPPNAVFGPVWTLLYTLMALALFLLWNAKADKQLQKKALKFFYAQLVLNFFWSVAFFGLQQPLLGLIVILVLWGLIQKTIQYSFPVSRIAAYLMLPYIAWVSFAALLNFAIAVLNF